MMQASNGRADIQVEVDSAHYTIAALLIDQRLCTIKPAPTAVELLSHRPAGLNCLTVVGDPRKSQDTSGGHPA